MAIIRKKIVSVTLDQDVHARLKQHCLDRQGISVSSYVNAVLEAALTKAAITDKIRGSSR